MSAGTWLPLACISILPNSASVITWPSSCVSDFRGHFPFLIKIPVAAAAAAKLLQSCPTLCDSIDSSPPSLGFSRQEHWSGSPFPSPKVKVKSLSCVWLLATPWTAAYQAPPSMGFSRQEYWSGVMLPSLQSNTYFNRPTPCCCKMFSWNSWDSLIQREQKVKNLFSQKFK